MGRIIGVHLDVDPCAGGEYQWWLSMLGALSEINREGKHKVIIFADRNKHSEIAHRYNLELVDFPKLGSKLQYAVNRLFEKRMPTEIYKKICFLWFPKLKKIKNRNVDIWITKTLKGVKKGLGVSCVSPIFDLMYLYLPEFPEVVEDIASRERTTKDLCMRADVLLADSIIGKKQIVESFGRYRDDLAQRVKILPYIPADYIYKRTEAVGFVKPFEKYLVYPAQLWKHKNHINLLKAINMLKEEGINVNIVFAGSEKNAGKDIWNYIEECDLICQVKILGYVTNEEIVSLYVNARAMIYPSFFGPTNIPPLEAMQLGCPSAISDVYGMPDQVGDAALLFDPKNVDEIKCCIKQLWEDDLLCDKLREMGYARSKAYGKKEFKKNIEEIINGID